MKNLQHFPDFLNDRRLGDTYEGKGDGPELLFVVQHCSEFSMTFPVPSLFLMLFDICHGHLFLPISFHCIDALTFRNVGETSPRRTGTITDV